MRFLVFALDQYTDNYYSRGLEKTKADAAEAGFDIEFVFVDESKEKQQIYVNKLTASPIKAVVIGAGVRLMPDLTGLFETLVNLTISHSPKTKLLFNVSPTTTVDAIKRWF